VRYTRPDGSIGSVHEDYTQQTKGYTKKRSDAFNRSQRFKLYIGPPDNGRALTTSVRQLNFMRFLVSNGILDYVTTHIEALHEAYTAEKLNEKEGDREKQRKLQQEQHQERAAHERPAIRSGQFELEFS
jgi:hypothetical protein